MFEPSEVEPKTGIISRTRSIQSDKKVEESQVEKSQSASTTFNSKEVINKKIMRYWHKKGKRITKKQIRYDCRQNLAKARFRYQGRFITKAEMEQLDRNEIYDPNLTV